MCVFAHVYVCVCVRTLCIYEHQAQERLKFLEFLGGSWIFTVPGTLSVPKTDPGSSQTPTYFGRAGRAGGVAEDEARDVLGGSGLAAFSSNEKA